MRVEKNPRRMQRERGFATTALTLLSLAALSLPASARQTGDTPDAHALVRQMIATYQAATTIQETSEAKFYTLGSEPYFQSNKIRFKRPNQVRIEAEDPVNGTLVSYCNGRSITVFSGRQNVYTRRVAPIEFFRIMDRIGKTTDEAVGIKSGQMLNPISFLISSPGTLKEAHNFRLAGERTVDGHRAYVVIGEADGDWLRELSGDSQVVIEKRDIILWIDAARHLLLKGAAQVTWHMAASTNVKGKVLVSGFAFEETHHDIRLNRPLGDEDFRFHPPRNAKELFQQTR